MALLPQAAPSSPTLTNPDLILPVRRYTPSPPPSQASTLLDRDLRAVAASASGAASVLRDNNASAFSGPRSPVTLRMPRPLSDIEEVEYPPKIGYESETLASSPILKQQQPPPVQQASLWKHLDDRRLSDGSSGSVHSDDLENMKWPDFDGGPDVDPESVLEEIEEEVDAEEEKFGYFPNASGSEQGAENENWLGPRTEASSESGDSFAQDPLSRRADLILANAKKRLNLMEGNLRGARSSLMFSPTAANRPYSALGSSTNGAGYGDREKHAPHSAYGIRSRQFPPSPLGSGSTPGHSRVVSETCVPSPAPSVPAPRLPIHPTRSSSALGGLITLKINSLERSASLRGVRSQEVMRDQRLQNWMLDIGRTTRGGPLHQATSEPAGLHVTQQRARSQTPPFEGINGQNSRRSVSAAGSLQAQMNELKGRISTLKEKAREEQLKRQSLNSMRTPSPFTAAEIWYQGAEAYKAPALSTDAGIGWSPNQSPVAQTLPTGLPTGGEAGAGPKKTNPVQPPQVPPSGKVEPRKSSFGHTESHYEDAEEELDEESPSGHGTTKNPAAVPDESTSSDSTIEVAEIIKDPDSDTSAEEENQTGEKEQGTVTTPPPDESREGRGDDDQSVDGQSVYFEAQPVAERHEDRPDAFDYEHFFLHSAMGSFTRIDRRDSRSSEDSIETTKPLPTLGTPDMQSVADALEDEDSPALHRRSQSIDSISTYATFKTATEGNGSNSGSESGEQLLDSIAHQVMSNHFAADSFSSLPLPQKMARRSNSVNHISYKKLASRHLPVRSNAGVSPVASIVNAMLEHAAVTDSTGFLDSDRDLLETVVESLQQVCLSLQRQPANAYDRRVWRRRMDAARRVLDGEYDPTIS